MTLEHLIVGDKVTLVADNEGLLFFQFNGVNIIKLSKQAQDKMPAFVNSRQQARVIALIRRQSDPDNDYDANNKIVQWCVPVIELMVKQTIKAHHG